MKILDLTLNYTDDGLISPAQKETIRQFAAEYPSEAVNFFGFETVLSDTAPTADFAFNLTAAGSRWLTEESAKKHSQLNHLASSWFQTGTDRQADASNFWLEYDTSTGNDTTLEPSVFVALTDMETLRQSQLSGGRSQTWIKEKLLKKLVAENAVNAIAGNLKQCLNYMPEATQKIQLGFMLSRKFPGIRLCLFNFTAAGISAYLNELNWPGNHAQVAEICRKYAPFCDSFCLHLDIGAHLYPTLGLELMHAGNHPWNWQPQFTDRWHHTFAQLQQDGLCTPQKAELLLNFPQQKPVTAPLIDKLLRSTLQTNSALHDLLLDGTLVMGLQHMKFKLDAAGNIVVKGYFGGHFEVTTRQTTPNPVTL